MQRDSSYSSGGKTEDSLGRACVGPPRDDATAHRTWDHGRRSSSSSSSSSSPHLTPPHPTPTPPHPTPPHPTPTHPTAPHPTPPHLTPLGRGVGGMPLAQNAQNWAPPTHPPSLPSGDGRGTTLGPSPSNTSSHGGGGWTSAVPAPPNADVGLPPPPTGGRGWHKAPRLGLFAFGGAYWPLATARSDPLWVRTCFGCVNGAPG